MKRSLVVLTAVLLLAASWGLWAQEAGERSERALAAMSRQDPGLIERGDLSPTELKVLQRLTPEQAAAWSEGEDPSGIILDDGRSLAEYL